jgi:DNA invertase Pin-like site-specific DNA recombinase
MTPKTLRCAVYTRKSSEEGLEQDFNSLHAQRAACEAYVLSQAGEGWICLATAYDDGGISGGTMVRPGLQRLLADIAAGRIDIVVVYKVDRLTRSLMDFAKIIDVFDKQGTSFVSVTQAFNTTTSMGRLTLNVLLSFAQFEREVTGERIRDKIAASKALGMWMGGGLPLGYDASGRTLVINEAEAEQVRHIFARYIELGSVHMLAAELEAQGYRSKRRMTSTGKEVGGAVMTRGMLFHLLANRTYLGQVPHKDKHFPGLHPPLLEVELFEEAQSVMAEHRRRRAEPSARRRASPLTGLIFDDAGEPMCPTVAHGKSGKGYRYYVTASLQQGAKAVGDDGIRRIPSAPLEAFISDALARITGNGATWERWVTILRRLDVREEGMLLHLAESEVATGGDCADTLQQVVVRLSANERAWLANGTIVVHLPVRLIFRGGRKWILGPKNVGAEDRPRLDDVMIAALRNGHRFLNEAKSSPLMPLSIVEDAQGIPIAYRRLICRLAFLAPDIQKAILEGRQPAGLTLQQLLATELPASWISQRNLLGFSPGGGGSAVVAASR